MESIKAKIKETKASEPQRAFDVLRAAVRALYTVNCLPGAKFVESFNTFYHRVLKTPQLVAMLEQLQNEKGKLMARY